MVSSLCFDKDGVTLVSGGSDSDIVVWDLVPYTALCRLRGHKDAVTGVSFLVTQQQPRQQYLLSVSKDTLLKVWDLETQCCVQTVVGHRCEIWSLAVLHRPQSNTGHEAPSPPLNNEASPSLATSMLEMMSSSEPSKVAGNNSIEFVESPALAPPEAEIDMNQMAKYTAELESAAAVPLPDGDDDDDDDL